jgi:hypothetical protein
VSISDQQLLLPATLGRASNSFCPRHLGVQATPSARDTWACKLACGCAAHELEPFCCYWFEQGHAQHAGVEALSYLTRNGLVCMLTRSATLYLPSSSMAVTGTLWLQQLHVPLLQRIALPYPPLMDVLAKYRHVRFTALRHGSWKAYTHRCMHAVVCVAWCKQAYSHASPSFHPA